MRAEAEVERQAQIAALTRERDGYVQRGLFARAALVDAELARVAAGARPPANRAEKRRRPRRTTP
jgi:hypothetical protein